MILEVDFGVDFGWIFEWKFEVVFWIKLVKETFWKSCLNDHFEKNLLYNCWFKNSSTFIQHLLEKPYLFPLQKLTTFIQHLLNPNL